MTLTSKSLKSRWGKTGDAIRDEKATLEGRL